MKKLILLLIIFLPFLAQAQSNPYVLGSVAASAPACTTSTDSLIIDKVGTGGSNYSYTYIAVKITLAAETTITQYDARGLDDGGNTGSSKISLWTHNAGSNQPDSEITGTDVSVAMSTIADTENTTAFILATPKTGIAAGTYWIVRLADTATVRHKIYLWSSAGDRITYSSDGSSWSAIDNYAASMNLYGCQ